MDKLETKEMKILRNKNLLEIQKYFSLSESRTLNWAERGGGVCMGEGGYCCIKHLLTFKKAMTKNIWMRHCYVFYNALAWTPPKHLLHSSQPQLHQHFAYASCLVALLPDIVLDAQNRAQQKNGAWIKILDTALAKVQQINFHFTCSSGIFRFNRTKN